MKDYTKHIIAFIIIVLAVLFVERNYLNEYPQYIHAWAEQDHYALAIGFINNDFDFFHPETMIYNKQFPSWWLESSETTVTSVDFPIHEYIVALLMSLFNNTSPCVFRLWTMILALTGLFFIFKMALLITNDWLKAILTTFIALSAPVFAYYTNGFLPGIPALTFGAIGLYFYLRYFYSFEVKYFNISVVFLTLATLIRTTFAIELIAILSFEMLRIFRKESHFIDKIPAVAVAFVVYFAYSIWKNHIFNQHGSIFLNYLMPAENLDEARELISDAYDKWHLHYFQKIHYYLIFISVLFVIGLTIYKSRLYKYKKQEKPLSFWFLPLIYVFGCLLFCIAMMRQIRDHDYYFIDTFFLPILFVIVLIFNKIPVFKNKITIVVEYLAVAVVCFFMIKNVGEMQTKRRFYNGAVISYQNFKNSDVFLDSLGVSHEAKILCMYGYAQNGPFIQMHRKGFIVMQDNDELVNNSLSWDYDYIVVENKHFSNYFEKRKEIFSHFEKIGDNGRISVFKYE